MQYDISSQSVYYTKYHIVWVTQYRRKILNPGMCSYLRKVIPKLLRSLPGVENETIGFDEDHLHMMLIPPKYSISDVIGKLKSQSSHLMRKTFSWLSKVYWKEKIVWLLGYFASNVEVNEQVIATLGRKGFWSTPCGV